MEKKDQKKGGSKLGKSIKATLKTAGLLLAGLVIANLAGSQISSMVGNNPIVEIAVPAVTFAAGLYGHASASKAGHKSLFAGIAVSGAKGLLKTVVSKFNIPGGDIINQGLGNSPAMIPLRLGNPGGSFSVPNVDYNMAPSSSVVLA